MNTSAYPANQNQRIIAVLGMHRSGTSALTRSLQVLGVRLGNELIAAQADNTKGFWEDAAIVQINKDMMAHLGRHWYSLAPITTQQADQLVDSPFFERASELLAQRLNTFTVFGFKDPRVAVLVQFWQAVFAGSGLLDSPERPHNPVCYVISIRHPLSVAQSLYERNGLPAIHAHWLWLSHTLVSLRATEGMQRVLVDYDELMAQPAHQLQRLSGALLLPVDAQALEQFENEFLDPAMRHASFDEQSLLDAQDCPPLIREVYPALLAAARDDISEADAGFGNKTRQWLDTLQTQANHLALADHWLDAHEKGQQALQEEQKERRRDQEAKQQERIRHQQAINDASRQAEQRASEHKQYIENLHRSHEQTAERHKKWQAVSDDKLLAEQQRSKKLEQSLKAKSAELEQALREKSAKLDRLEASHSWRLTRPFRSFSSFLSRMTARH